MKPQQARLAVDVFTVAVIISVALAFASLTWRVQGYDGTSPVTAPIVTQSFDVRGLQNALAAIPFAQPDGANVVVGSDEVTLRAVFAAEPAAASVALIAGPDGIVAPFAIGEVTPGGVVEAIEPERVLLRSGSGLRVLSFEPASTPSGPPPGTADAQPAPTAAPEALGQSPPPPPPPSARDNPPDVRGVDLIRSLIPPDARGNED